MAKYMNDEVPGVSIPLRLMMRMAHAEKVGNAQEEGVQIALELIEKIKKFEAQGVNGLHIMAVGWEEIVPRIISEAKIHKTGSIIPEREAEQVPA